MTALVTPKIAVVGHVCVDMRVRPTIGFPEPGQLVGTDNIELVTGGTVGNFGRVLGPLGEPAIALCRVGTDVLGDVVAQQLATWADTSYVTRSTTSPTSGTIVFVLPDGERSFIHAKGANTEFAADHIPLEALAAAGVHFLHLGYAMLLPALDGPPMVEVLRRARTLGMTTSLDITWDPTGRWMQDVGPLLPHVDIFCPNDAEAQALTGFSDPALAGMALLAAGVRRLVVVTCGARGLVACWPDGRSLSVPATPAVVADSTGAGDCCFAGLLAGLAHGMSDADALAFGVQTASAALTNDTDALAHLRLGLAR
jgi:sugar/nucleoside kinase (ribokinase family)